MLQKYWEKKFLQILLFLFSRIVLHDFRKKMTSYYSDNFYYARSFWKRSDGGLYLPAEIYSNKKALQKSANTTIILLIFHSYTVYIGYTVKFFIKHTRTEISVYWAFVAAIFSFKRMEEARVVQVCWFIGLCRKVIIHFRFSWF